MRFNLIKFRKLNNISQEELASALDCSRVHISDIENCKTNPSFGLIEKFEVFCSNKNIVIEDIWELFKKE